ncbi:hypothetical protein Vafri_11880 [Volvox africanus]|uniref:Uncharacterized protein n=1 Tax=Volvox africanus TaxID=51714 RepID=A0A8J4B8V6_9CHLO|nr:hypothetical protein Vafri_11880 [Volvox africanus]
MAARIPYVCALCGVPCSGTASHSKPPARNTHHGDPWPWQEPHQQQKAQNSKKKQKQSCVCASCGAMYYCCDAHCRRHATLPGGHSIEECKRMAAQLQRAAELADFPFPWFRSINTINQTGVSKQDRMQDPRIDADTTNPAWRQVLNSSDSDWRPADPSGSQSASRLTCPDTSFGTETAMETATEMAVSPFPAPTPTPMPQSLCSLLHSLRQQAAAHPSGAACSPLVPTPQHPVQLPAHTGTGVNVTSAIDIAISRRAIGDIGDMTLGPSGQPRDKGGSDDTYHVRGTGFILGAADQETDDGLRCMAPGCWRRLCGCGGSGGRGRSLGDRDGEDGDWGLLQPPLLALVLLPPRGQSTAAPSDHAEWSRRVWHLPPNLTPPLRVPTGKRRGGGKVEARLSPPPLPLTMNSGSHEAQAEPRVAVMQSGASPSQRLEQVQQQQHVASQSSKGAVGDGDCHDGLYGPCGVMDWLSYYRWAGLPVESPAALLLHFPLTLYGALRLVDERLHGALLSRGCRPVATSASKSTERAPKDGEDDEVAVAMSPGCPSGDGGTEEDAGSSHRAKRLRVGGCDPEVSPMLIRKPATATATAIAGGQPEGMAGGRQRWCVDVLYLGPQAELDQLDTFAVLLPLLPPGCTLRLHMVGPDVPDNLHGAVLVYDGDDLGVSGQSLVAPSPPIQGCGNVTECAGVATHHQDGAGCGERTAGNAAGASFCSDGVPGLSCKEAVSGYRGMPEGLCPRLELQLYSCMLHEADGLLGGVLGWVGGAGGNDCLQMGDCDWAVDGDDGGSGNSSSRLSPGARAAVTDCAVGCNVAEVSKHTLVSPRRSGVRPSRSQQPAPLLVFAPNAGLPVYRSWLPSLELILAGQDRPVCAMGHSGGAGAGGGGPAQSPARPAACLFTAYNEEECVRSCQLLEQLFNLQPDIRNLVNPYRQPLWCVDRIGNGLPSYSNGFLYGWFAA